MIIYTGNYSCCEYEVLSNGFTMSSSFYEMPPFEEGWCLFIPDSVVLDRPGALCSEAFQYELGIRLCSVMPSVKLYTHSDFLFTGVRVGVKRGLIPQQDVKVIYYSDNNDRFEVPIQSNGHVHDWPEGFFDVLDYAYSELFNLD